MNEMTDEQVERMLNDTFTCDELERLRHRKDFPMKTPSQTFIAREIQQHCPPGYRFLLQCIRAENEEQAREQVARTFRRSDAVFVRGVYRSVKWNAGAPWIWDAGGGYMAFVPTQTDTNQPDEMG